MKRVKARKPKNYKYTATGRKVRKDPKKQRAARRLHTAANTPAMKATTKAKIRRAVKRMLTTGRVKSGRRAKR